MEIDRPHRTTTTTTSTSDLFICFTSRLSHSSSMRLSTRSILSPGRGTGGGDRSSAAVATTLSRRLRRNGSLRGGAQSPALFPATSSTTKRSRGSSAFAENPEPSSPKVTCIGQVRVKTKKQGKKMKLRACGSKRIGGEASFRRIHPPPPPQDVATEGGDSPARNPRWVHLPLSICETLKGLGSDFSCLLPCKSSCFSSSNSSSNNNNNDNNSTNNGNNGGSSSCGGVFRWWVSVEEGEEGRRRDIELVVGGNDDDEEEEEEEVVEKERVRVMERECSRRRSIFDDMEFDDLFNGVSNNVGSNSMDNDCGGGDGDGEVEAGRVSVCVPPKNALLLMRCKSDPMKMASLSKKFFEASFVECHSDGEEGGVVEVERGNRVEFGEEVGVRVRECGVVKEESHEVCGDLEVGETNGKDFAEISENLVDKSEELVVTMEENEKESVEEIVLEGIEEKHGVEMIEEVEEKRSFQNRDETEEEQGVLEEENRDETVEEQGVLEEENRDETVGEQSGVDVDEDEEILENMEETEIMVGENSVIEVVDEEEVDESEIWQIFEEMPRYESMEVEEKGKREESHELLSLSSNCCSSLEESKELDLKEEYELKELDIKEESVEVVKEGVVEEGRKSMEKEVKKSILPDCLLLMMCEPKLSMEVSKETWICRSDFIRCLPERHPKQKPNKSQTGNDQAIITTKKTKPAAVAAHPPPLPMPPAGIRPGRSSISFPTGGTSVANLIEQKLAKAGVGVGYEPFVLPRCKSAPLRSTMKYGTPELACSVWGRENGQKLEPHRPATCGVGAGGVGF